MPMTFPCRACGKKVRTSRSAQGKWGKCPHCNVEYIIPTLLDSRIEATAESGERAPLTNTMADTVSAPAPASVPAGPSPSSGLASKRNGRALTWILTLFLGPGPGWWYAAGCGMGACGIMAELAAWVVAGLIAGQAPLVFVLVVLAAHVGLAVMASRMCEAEAADASSSSGDVYRWVVSGVVTLIVLIGFVFAMATTRTSEDLDAIRRRERDAEQEREWKRAQDDAAYEARMNVPPR
jgi:hypothetical protein